MSVKPEIVVTVFANKKLLPAFRLVEEMQPVRIIFSDWQSSISGLIDNIKLMRQADVVYFHSPSNMRILLMPIAKLLRKKIMLQWIGGDVLIACHNKKQYFYDIASEQKVNILTYTLSALTGLEWLFTWVAHKYNRLFLAYLRCFVDHHISCAQHLSDDLKSVGVEAKFIELVNPRPSEILPWSDEFAVITYLGYFDSSDTKDYYGWNTALRLAQDYPDLTIYAVGRGQPIKNVPPNIVMMDFVDDILQLLARVKGVLRASYYDGTARLVVEALCVGRYVGYTLPLPGCHLLQSYADAKQFVEFLRDQTQPNEAGRAQLLAAYDPAITTSKYYEAFRWCASVA